MCDDPPPQFGGDICEGMLVEVQKCEGKAKKCKKGRAKSPKKKGQGTGNKKGYHSGSKNTFNLIQQI